MSPAFLMLTSAWLASADAAPAPAPVASSPVVSTGSGCGGGCSTCGDSYGGCDSGCRPSLFDRLKGRFHRSHDCGCDTGCAAPVVHAAPACDTCAPKHHHHYSAPVVVAAPSCGCHDACDSCKPSFFDRLKAKFRRGHDCGCDTGYSTGCATGGCSGGGGFIAAPTSAPTTAPAGEAIPAPKSGEAKPLPKAAYNSIEVPARLGNEQEGPKVAF